MNDLIEIFLKDERIIKFIHETIKFVFPTIKFSDKFIEDIIYKLHIDKNKNNIKIIKKFFNDIVTLFSQNEFNMEIFINGAIKFLSNDSKLSLQTIIDFLLGIDKNHFWNKINKFDIYNFNKESFKNFVMAFDLIFNNLTFDGIIFTNIINLTTPKDLLYKSSDKVNVINLMKYLGRLNKVAKPVGDFFKRLLENYYVSNLKTKDNIYYKTFFRFALLLLISLRQIFQKNIKRNIFIGDKISIVTSVFRMMGYKFGKNKSIDKLILNMFSQDDNYDLKLQDKNENNILYLIFTLDKNKKDVYNSMEKIKIIFNIIKNGYIE